MAEILNERGLEYYIAAWTLVPAMGGRFELEVNGDLMFSKKALGRHAEPGEIRDAVIRKLESIKPDWQIAEEAELD
ncbi:MAG: Rdx family protein [Anaerolineae bacterium]|nr:Rdx family protein [Anaerolineae bacterium]NUQ06452.1 hypothetical protein [Anaerolineae bacterium]